MSKELEQCGCVQKPLTIEECIDRLETLFKAYQKDSEFNYQLSISNSPFNTLKHYAKAFEILREKGVRELSVVADLCNWDWNEYVKLPCSKLYTKTEFNLLKEYLA